MDFPIPQYLLNDPITQIRLKMLEDGKFATLKNDEDRAKFMVDKLIAFSFYDFDCHETERKNPKDSAMYRTMGNRAFTGGIVKWQFTFDLYCKSIVYAPLGSKELSLAYGNRSAVLFKARFYEDCLIDIERALAIDCPEESRAKLFIRKAKCLYAINGEVNQEVSEALAEAQKAVEKLDADDENRCALENILKDPNEITSTDRRARKLTPITYVPKLTEENPKLAGASASVALKYSKKYGRHIVASRDIKAGEVLMVQKPYFTMVAPESAYSICGYCNKQNWTGIPCDHCIHVMYCSEECKQMAWTEYHDVECAVLAKAIATKLSTHSLMGIRMTIMALKEAGSFEALEKRLKKLDSMDVPSPQLSRFLPDSWVPDKRCRVDFTFNPNSYDSIYVLDDNTHLKSQFELIHWASNSVLATFFMATQGELFGEKLPRQIKLMKNKKWFAMIAGMTARNMKISKTHSFQILSNSEKDWSSKIHALVPAYCFFNHSCYAPTEMNYHQQFATVTSIAPFKKGEQIFVSYTANFMEQPKESRHAFLLKEFLLTCDCVACKGNWTKSSCTSYHDQGLPNKIVEKLDAASKVFLRIMGDKSRAQADVLMNIQELSDVIQQFDQHVSMPCIEMMGMQEHLSELYRRIENQYITLDE